MRAAVLLSIGLVFIFAVSPTSVRGHGSPLQVQARSEAELGRLVVLVQEGEAVSQSFLEYVYPALRDVTAELRIPAHTVDVSLGAPPEIKSTPAIIFQNYLGRSIYEGRYDDVGRIKAFLRTSRYVAQSPSGERQARPVEDVALLRIGRAQVAVEVHLNASQGAVLEDFQREKFRKEILEHVGKGFERFKTGKDVDLHRGDRFYRIEISPFLKATGRVGARASIVSEFEPWKAMSVIEALDLMDPRTLNPVPWEDRKELWRKLGRELERTLLVSLVTSTSGKGFEPLDAGLPELTWEDMELPLPPRSEERINPAAKGEPGANWVLAPSQPDYPPQVMMLAPEPHDRFRVVADALSGRLEFDSGDLVPETARGWIEVAMDSLSTGNEDEDERLRSARSRRSEPSPRARLVIDSFHFEEPATLTLGTVTHGRLLGSVVWREVSLELEVPATFELVIDHHGLPQLLLSTRFRIDPRALGVDRPEALVFAQSPEAGVVDAILNVAFLLEESSTP